MLMRWVSVAALAATLVPAHVEAAMPYQLDAVPEGYHLQACDDCGVADRQPHVQCAGVHTYSPAHVNADLRARSVAWDWQEVRALYEGLNPKLPYVVAVTYANEPFNARVQSLWAGDVPLHGPRPLPRGGVERLCFRVPPEAMPDGRLLLRFRLEGPVNAVVSAIELWAPAPSPPRLHIDMQPSAFDDVRGHVLDLGYAPVPRAAVTLTVAGRELLETHTEADGSFVLPRRLLEGLDRQAEIRVDATEGGREGSRTMPVSDFTFEPVRYRPIPAAVSGVRRVQRSLDGVWRIQPKPPANVREVPLSDPSWATMRVPGQWVQAGFDVPLDQTVAMAREFRVPREWAGRRVILRFDSIHAGTRYWLNGRLLGESEHLYTPVEFDVTEAVRLGEINRLDLEMKVDTLSERLANASGYAFHNLGGIDRSVRLFALPPVHVRHLRLITDLDAAYQDATLRLDLGVENATGRPAAPISLGVRLLDPHGRPVALPRSEVSLGGLAPGTHVATLTTGVANPLKWSAEKPHLYRLILELRQGRRVLETIERHVGFRKIEVRGRQLYLNGRRIKLAGACRHETDPLSGRANTMHLAEGDVKLLKAANLNYIRTSHYPPPQELLDAADRIGMYVEVEAPFCWVSESDDLTPLRAVLTPTSAMVDYCHTHPSVLLWSLANESAFNAYFAESHRLCKAMDPTRPTTFNHPFARAEAERICDIANLHYPPMPYDALSPDDPRPLLLGEYFFPVCHEQTDVRINPGLRELWAHGHAEPDSEWGRDCAASFTTAFLQPGALPGAWSHIVHSDRVIGGAIWAAFDEPFYLPGGKRVGYAWVHGFWGLIDGWRRPKPEWWLAKLLFSPVWFPKRTVDFSPGQRTVRVPVENRYAFTDLQEVHIEWEAGGRKGRIPVSLPPGQTGEILLTVPEGARPGDQIGVRVTDRHGALINALAIHLGKREPEPVPQPEAGPPRYHDDGQMIVITGDRFSLVLDRATGELQAADRRHRAPLLRRPMPHVTRFDYADLLPSAPPYAVFPDDKTREVTAIGLRALPQGLEIAIRERYDRFEGVLTWLIDRRGVGKVTCDYVYTGEEMGAREVGVRCLLRPECDQVRWRRWSEWDVYPEDHIGRTEGVAHARRRQNPRAPESQRPAWPWALDQNELGTNDFRAVKLNVYEASVTDQSGTGLRLRAAADRHLRACLAEGGVAVHLLTHCRLGPVTLKPGDRIRGDYAVEILR